MAASILRYELKGKARTRPDIFRLVLGPCAQCCPCEASELKIGPKTVIFNHGDKALNVSSFNLSRKNKQFKKEYQNRLKMNDLCQLENRTLKWKLAYFGPKVGYFGHIL